MASKFRLKELRIVVKPGVTLIADVETVEDVQTLLEHLSNSELYDPKAIETKDGDIEVRTEKSDARTDSESPESRIELRAELAAGYLRQKNVLAFKDGVPQLLRPTSFPAVTDAALVLVFAVEAGLKKSSISFDDFKALYEEQNIKSGSSLAMLLNNLKNAGYLDKNAYSSDRTIRLSAKGEKKAADILKSQGQ